MPRQEYKESTINDQAYILKFSNSPNYYLRLKGRGGKDTSLETDDLETARSKAVKVISTSTKIQHKKDKEIIYLRLLVKSGWIRSRSE